MVLHSNRGPFPLTPENVKIELLKTYQTEPALEAARDISHQWLRARFLTRRVVGVVPRRFGTMQAVKNHRFGPVYIRYANIFDGNDGNWSVLVIGDRTGKQQLWRFVEVKDGTIVNEENVGELCCSKNKWLISRYR